MKASLPFKGLNLKMPSVTLRAHLGNHHSHATRDSHVPHVSSWIFTYHSVSTSSSQHSMLWPIIVSQKGPGPINATHSIEGSKPNMTPWRPKMSWLAWNRAQGLLNACHNIPCHGKISNYQNSILFLAQGQRNTSRLLMSSPRSEKAPHIRGPMTFFTASFI